MVLVPRGSAGALKCSLGMGSAAIILGNDRSESRDLAPNSSLLQGGNGSAHQKKRKGV